MAAFRRQQWDLGGLDAQSLVHLAAVGAGYGPHTNPEQVPWEVLDAMAWDPVIYLGERALVSVADNRGLYYVVHDDPRVRAEVEAWLEPVMPALVASILPAFAYGCAPMVLDYTREDLATKVTSEGGSERSRNLRGHVHFSRAHSINPGEVGLRVDRSDALLALVHGSDAYEGREEANGRPVARRAFVPIWGRRWGRWTGQGSRRRAYRAWYTGGLVSLWQGRYLERSVDVPRIGYAPNGNVTVAGEEVPAVRILTSALMSLKNGSACVIPSEQDPNNGAPLWRIEPLQLPDRSKVWTEALGYWDAKKLEACLMPPGIATGQDVLSSAKVADGLMRDFVQDVANFVAAQLTEIVRAVHRLNGGAKPYPVIRANEVPQARRKLLLEVLKSTVGVTQHLADGRTYTLGELVHPELLEQLGIRARPVEEAAHKPSAPVASPSPDMADAGGRPRDASGQREERREAARTDAGEDATGAEGEGED